MMMGLLGVLFGSLETVKALDLSKPEEVRHPVSMLSMATHLGRWLDFQEKLQRRSHYDWWAHEKWEPFPQDVVVEHRTEVENFDITRFFAPELKPDFHRLTNRDLYISDQKGEVLF